MPKPFATDRTLHFQETELSAFLRQKVDDIEEFGYQILHVVPRIGGPKGLSFSYTTGLFDTCGKPEIVEVGLPQRTASALLHEAAKRLQQGIDLGVGRHGDLIGKVECEFRPVDPKWARHILLGCNWYYKETDYPVVQAIYPDLDNRFPEDPGFDQFFIQPLLQPGAPFNKIEEQFWGE